MYKEKTYAVGDEVGMVRYSSHYNRMLEASFGIVRKINGHGHIEVQRGEYVIKFDKRGNAYKNNYGPSLIDAAELRQRIAEEAKLRYVRDTAKGIEDVLKQNSNYMGFCNSEEAVSKLEELVAKLRSELPATE